MFGAPNYNYTPWYQQSQNNSPQQGVSGNIIWVQGEAGAKSCQVLAGQTVLLMDSEQQVFYIKKVDESGIPQPLRIFPYSEKVVVAKNATTVQQDQSDYITREEFEKTIAELKDAKSSIPAA